MPRLEESLARVYEWAKSMDFMGHDPHDVLTSPYLRLLRGNSSMMQYGRLLALQVGRRSAVNLRALLRVPRAENPKALALFLEGLVHAKDNATPHWNADAADIADRLLHATKSAGWGYPFPWQSRTHFLPRFTPNIVTTAFVGNAILEWNKLVPSAQVEHVISDAATYVVSLQVSPPTAPDSIAFGYAASDPQIVFNASLLGAYFLLNAGKLLSNAGYIDYARRAAQFVASYQRKDGAWEYGLEKSQHWIDSFHTGFTIRAMNSIAQEVSDERLQDSARRGFEYYKRKFLEPDYAIRYFSERRYPIDAHALGEAMLTCTAFGEPETARKIAEWTTQHMQSPKGFFYYQRHRLFTNRIPYIRWSNAWIFRGLAEVVGACCVMRDA